MRKPADPLVNQSGAFSSGEIFEIVGNVFGMANAPLVFCNHVREIMYSIGWHSHTLDTMCFTFRSENGELLGVALFHVDDLLLTVSPLYNLSELRSAFTWGTWEQFPAPIVWSGWTIVIRDDGCVLAHQAQFTQDADVRKFSVSSTRDPNLSPAERTEFKSVGGSVQWLASHARVDLAAPCSLLQKGELTVKDLQDMNKLMIYAKEDPYVGYVFRPLDLLCLLWVCWMDSSWANADAFKSQAGCLLTLTEECAYDTPTWCSIMDHKSSRSQRVVRSTLAAEASAADGAIDRLVYLVYFFHEITHGVKCTDKQAHSNLPPMMAYTDCRSLYDALQQLTPSLTEKRTIIDICAIREAVGRDLVRWCPGDSNHADGLTKYALPLLRKFTSWLKDPWVTLRNPDG